MEYVSVIAAFLALLIGSFIILGIVFYGRRFGDRGSMDLLAPFGLLLLITLVYFAHARLPAVAFDDDLGAGLVPVAAVARLCLGLAWPWFLHRHLALNELPWRRRFWTPYAAGLTIANILLYVASRFVSLPWVDTVNSLILSVCLFYAGGSAVVAFARHPSLLPSSRAAVTVAALSLIVFPLVSLADLLHFSYPFFRPDLPVWYQSQPLYVLIVEVPLLMYMRHGVFLVDGAPGAAERERFNLSEREREVAVLLTKGESYKEIAFSLGISLATVKTHVVNTYAKTHVRNKFELGRLLQVDPPSPAAGSDGRGHDREGYGRDGSGRPFR